MCLHRVMPFLSKWGHWRSTWGVGHSAYFRVVINPTSGLPFRRELAGLHPTCSTTHWHASVMQCLLCTVSVHTTSHLLWRLSGVQREVCPGLLSSRLHARVGVQAGLCFWLCRGRDSWLCQLDVVSAQSFFELFIANQVCWPSATSAGCSHLRLLFIVLNWNSGYSQSWSCLIGGFM